MIKNIWILIFVLFLIGCSSKEDLIKYPENIAFDGEHITFDAVDQATSYSIKINDEVYQTDTPMFLIPTIPNGTYEVRVKTNGSTTSSYYSPAFTLTIDRDYASPSNISRNEMILSWDEVSDALSYVIRINDNIIDSINLLSYDLSNVLFEPNTLYNITVGALYETTDIAYSNPVYYHTYIKLNLDLEATYEQDFVTDLTYDFGEPLTIEHIMLDGTPISFEDYQFEDGLLTIHVHALQNELEAVESLEILTSDGMILITIRIIDAKPKMISDATIDYQYSFDMQLEFMLNGGSFVSLSGNNITSEDYQFEDPYLIINSSYIENILLDNPDRERIILLYQLEKSDDIVMGFIFIELKD